MRNDTYDTLKMISQRDKMAMSAIIDELVKRAVDQPGNALQCARCGAQCDAQAGDEVAEQAAAAAAAFFSPTYQPGAGPHGGVAERPHMPQRYSAAAPGACCNRVQGFDKFKGRLNSPQRMVAVPHA